jgi:hypothetical protein
LTNPDNPNIINFDLCVTLYFIGVCFTFGASQLAGLCTGSIYRIKQDEKISMGARAKSSGQHGRAKRGRLGHYG